jgi:hypothetical protein
MKVRGRIEYLRLLCVRIGDDCFGSLAMAESGRTCHLLQIRRTIVPGRKNYAWWAVPTIQHGAR